MNWEKLLKDFNILEFGYTEESLPLSKQHFEDWIEKNNHLPLHYLSDERAEKRKDIRSHWPEFQSAIVFLFNYHSTHQALNHHYETTSAWNGLKLASYTLGFEGHDYHHQLKKHLEFIGNKLREEYELDYKLALDVHPVLDRDLAFKCGLGWFGKNSMLINRHGGSFTIIGSLLLNKKLPLSTKTIETDHCGQCTRCIESCPTDAIDPVSRTIKAQDCISTFTIEQFKLDTPVPEKMDLTKGTIFGCDICQDVCPWNKRVDRLHPLTDWAWNEKQKEILDFFSNRPVEQLYFELQEMSGKQFEKKFKQTSFERSGKRGLLKNLTLYKKQKN